MKRLSNFTFMFVLTMPALLGAGQSFARGTYSTAFGTSTSQSQQDAKPPQDDKDKSSKDKGERKKDKRSIDDETVPATFSDAVAQSVLQKLSDALEGHSDRLMLSAFDDNEMDGYLNFEDQILAFFQRYDSFRVHFRISQATTEGSKGIVLVDIELEQIPRSANAEPVRKHDQIRLEMERNKKDWKIVDLRPRDFFS